MTAPLLFPMPRNEAMARSLAPLLQADVGQIETRSFPDGETYLRFVTDVAARVVVLVCTLDRPDDKILPLLFAAATARELHATSVGLVAPYLAYMRQDRRFQAGEAVTSRTIARLLSDGFDWLVTVDPHLHRYKSLADIYRIPTRAVHAAPLMSEWIREHVASPLIIGPDSESEQWVAAVAKEVASPFVVLEKVRRGDRQVEISTAGLAALRDRTPVLIDDIVSSGQTMVEAVRLIRQHSDCSPICVAVHGIFADHSDELLAQAGAQLVTSNSIPHDTNRIDLSKAMARSISEMIALSRDAR